MKKNYFSTVLIAFAIGLFTNNIYAQGTYIDFNVGYGFRISSQNIEWPEFHNFMIVNSSVTSEQVNVSLGKGFSLGGAFGYMFNKNIGAELGVSYLIGGKSKAQNNYTNDKIDYTLSSKMLRINPSIVISSGFDGINPYAKFGLIIGSGSIMYEYNDNNDGNIEITKMKMNGGLALGLSSSIGVLFNLNDKMSFFGELNMINLSYAPTKGEIIEATYNGTDELPKMTTSEKEIEFVDSYSSIINYNNSSADSQPRQELKYMMPFGSFGINFGLKISL
jgi:hypothetical protein